MNLCTSPITQSARYLTAVCAVALLSACGGGSDTPAPVALTLKQDVATTFAKQAATAQMSNGRMADVQLAYGYRILYILTSTTTGSRAVPIENCLLGGTVSATIVKSGNYLGLKSGDSVSYSFDKCADDGSWVDGKITAAADGVFANLGQSGVVSLKFSLKTEGFRTDLKGASSSLRSTGTLAVTTGANLTDGSYSAQFTSPTGYVQEVFPAGTVSLASSAGAIAAITRITPSAATPVRTDFTNLSAIANGTATTFGFSSNMTMVTAAANGNAASGFTLSTSIAVSGAEPAGVPNSGTFRLSNIVGYPNTTVTVTIIGALATVAVDTNGDGVAEFSFTLSSASLVGL